ncbi:PREDICTED: LOW QUALITY PROTEIN: disintegrin and metalloproteinase domain-containing protein 9-like [Cariama cristata]|uniref:LOW QUALITY PROTEIN: disintegrin and metalloproteinase domain-containing protein 9-like n=1 Tax=Cariama cristata TaxID=54380 RepID=UPI000520A3DC|nr:PREDICTED: LOW QUALITY PROTEIN: disintegrin and metalloproteinase domain-containing protein 9-like [Cariama cristata]
MQPRCIPMGRGLLLLGLLCVLLWGLGLPGTDGSPQPSQGYTAYEIVIPRKLDFKAGKASQDKVSYIISIQGVYYTIHLRQKDFVIENLPVFIRDSQGEITAEQPHVSADCYYHGYVGGILDSAVTLTICSGLRGLLQIGNSRYLELLVVVDKEGFDASGRSITNVTLEVVEIINLVDALFYPFCLCVLMTALEVWVEKNPISVTNNITNVLHNFNLWWKQQSLTYAMHDVGCLFTSMDFDHHTRALHMGAKSNFASACDDRKRASAVVSFAKQPYTDTAVHVARALGYVLGMEQDDRNCRCGNTSKCIMSAHGTGNYQFSNCSKKSYFDFIASGQGFCLSNAPESGMTFAPQRCGNGVLEAGEECDCGSEAQCKLDLCCDNACQKKKKKKKRAICTSGGCCKNCKPLPEGEVCRESAGLCDLPEYCNGTSEHCPADVAKQDRTLCAEDEYCDSGKCQSHTLQCMSIFGKEAKPAPLPCFQEVNTKGDRFGNCWGDGADISFQKCKLENVLCGRVQCTNVRRLPQLEDHTTIIQTPVGDTWCWGTDYHLGMDVLDAGVIKDGMQCGEKKFCINRTGKGVCNTRATCHCANGWAPPCCQFVGFGGSVDSGPTAVTKKGLFWFNIRITVITAAVLALTALVVVHVRKLRVTQALNNRLVRCFGARERAPEKDAKDQVEEDGSKPAESQNSAV